jgi:AraC family transcriptional regulator
MRLESRTYFGTALERRVCAGLCLTLSQYGPGLQPWHVHANPTLYVLLAGGQRDRSRRAEFEQPHWIAVFHPTTEPHASLVGPSGMVGLNVEFDEPWLHRHELAERDLGGYGPIDDVWSRLAALQLLTSAFASGPYADADIDSRTLELVEPLVQRSLDRAQTNCPPWLRRAREYLHDAYRSPIRVQAVAREVGVHPVHLTRVFRRRHGCSVSDYLRRLRLAEAARLILRHGHTIAEAAHESGFADQAHLCRCFSSAFGISPKKYRSAIQILSNRSVQPPTLSTNGP